MKFEGLLGFVNKIDFIKFLYKQFDISFQKDQFRPETSFCRAYGIKGTYLSDLDEDIPSSPLVLIQSQDLAELVAAKQLADYLVDSDDYTDAAIQKKAKEIARNYLIENGMTEETYNLFHNQN